MCLIVCFAVILAGVLTGNTSGSTTDCFSPTTDICNAEIPEIPNLSTRDPTYVMTMETTHWTFCDVYSINASQWYRSKAKMSNTSCPSMYTCGTKFPIWMKGQNPEPEEGVVNRTSCLRDFDSCCLNTYNLTVVNCGEFMAYCFVDLPSSCHQRYCFDIGQSSTIEPQQTNEHSTGLTNIHGSTTDNGETDTSRNGDTTPIRRTYSTSSSKTEHPFRNALHNISTQLTIALSVIGILIAVICGLIIVIIRNKRSSKVTDKPEKEIKYETSKFPDVSASEKVYHGLTLDTLDIGKFEIFYNKLDFVENQLTSSVK